jgi:hypothetical protein
MITYALIIGRSAIPEDLAPGGHVALFSVEPDLDGLYGRAKGLELRDTLLVLSPRVMRFILLFRKPISERSIAGQVLKTGTGILNIDACRVKASDPFGFGGGRWMSSSGNTLHRFSKHYNGDNVLGSPLGRWPPNMLLVHGPGCKQKGMRKYYPAVDMGMGIFEFLEASEETSALSSSSIEQHEDGIDTVPEMDCQDDCPVRLLTVQELRDPYSDGTSRFFPQFKDDYELVAWIRKLLTPMSTSESSSENAVPEDSITPSG